MWKDTIAVLMDSILSILSFLIDREYFAWKYSSCKLVIAKCDLFRYFWVGAENAEYQTQQEQNVKAKPKRNTRRVGRNTILHWLLLNYVMLNKSFVFITSFNYLISKTELYVQCLENHSLKSKLMFCLCPLYLLVCFGFVMSFWTMYFWSLTLVLYTGLSP